MKNLIKLLLLLLLIIQPISAIPSTVTIKPKIYTKDGLLRGLHDVRVKMYDQDRNVIFEELVSNVLFNPRGWGSIELGKGAPYPPKEALNAESISMGFILPKFSNEEEEIIGMVSIGFALMAKEAGSIEFKGIKNLGLS